VDKAEALVTVRKILELTEKGYRLKDIVKITGWERTRVIHVRKRRTYARAVLAVDDLKLAKSDKLCRRCAEPAGYVSMTQQLLCIKCTISELVKQGLILLTTRESTDDPQED
jgi:hypothetical protein